MVGTSCGKKSILKWHKPCGRWRNCIASKIQPSHIAVLHPLDRRGSFEAVACPSIQRRPISVAQHHGRGSEPQRLPSTQGAQGQAAKETSRNRCHLYQYKGKRWNSVEDENSVNGKQVKRLSIDCKATVNIGDYSRGGKTRGDARAADHDMGCEEKYVPFGIVDEDEGALYLTFGSSFKTSDFIADSLMGWWENTPAQERAAIAYIQIKVDNGPESSGVPRSSLSASWNSPTIPEQSSNCCTIRLTIASIIRLNVAGAFWSSTGMEPSW